MDGLFFIYVLTVLVGVMLSGIFDGSGACES